MKKTISIIIAAVGLLHISSCDTNEIDKWEEKGFVWFTDTIQDFTNMLQPDVPEGGQLTISVPLTIASEIADHDRIVNVEVARQPHDQRTQFEVQSPAVIRAGRITDTLYVKLTNSSHLDVVYDSISLRVIPSSDFEPGIKSNVITTICLHNGYPRPSWWDEDCEWSFGYFTQLKMQIYVAVTGGTDDPRSSKNASWYDDLAVEYWKFLLNDYIEQNDIRYPDDDPDAPGEQPVFDGGSY